MAGKIRVIQYGVGPIGAAIVRLLLEKPNVRIVGAIDIDPAKAGKDLGEVAEAGRTIGLRISNRPEKVLRKKADVVVHSTASRLTDVASQLDACLGARLAVVSTCEELAYPFRTHSRLARQLDRRAKQKKVALLGTGVNPGFVMDKMVLTLAAACQKIASVRVRRVVDAGQRRLPLQKKVGAGLTEAEFRTKVAAGEIKHYGLPESAALVADALGLKVDEIRESIEPMLAQETIRTKFLEVPAGRVAGVHQVARGLGGGEEKLVLDLAMYVGATSPMDEISIRGVPNLSLCIPGGTHGDLATAAVVVNSLPAVLEARPGLRTTRDIPLCYFSGT
jgi:4-hydroxy-tetrahydrodipicolinate reductase